MRSRLKRPFLAILVFLGLFAFNSGSAFAAPGDPLPTATLAQVQAGATCEARTVMHGTTISSFSVEIIEVVDDSQLAFGDLIYFKIVDPDVAAIGVAQGMSGSPILCPIAGEQKVIGAISYGFSGVGPKGFATPINDVLNGQPSPKKSSAKSQGKMTYKGRELVELRSPLTVTGVPSVSRDAFRKRLAKQGFETVRFSGPATVDVPAASPDLAPGGAFSMNMVFGDVSVGAICTITYRDGDDFWGCGHPLDLAGQRSQSISGAYIFDVVGQPWSESPPFKFGAATRTQVGTMLYDGPYAVSGRLGVTAPSVPAKLNYKSEGKTLSLQAHLANEYKLPGGAPYPFISSGDVAVLLADKAQFSGTGQPTIQHGRICVKQSVIGASVKANSCNRFASSGPRVLSEFLYTGASMPVANQIFGLTGLLGGVEYKALYPGAIEIDLSISTGSALRRILSLRAIGKVQVGKRATFQVVSADRNGKRYRRNLKVKIPNGARIGPKKPLKKAPSRSVNSNKATFYLGSDAIFDPSLEEIGGYFATDASSRGYFGFFMGRIKNERDLAKTVKAMYQSKAKLALDIPGIRKPIMLPLQSGKDLLVGGARTSVKVLPAKRIR